MASSAVPGIHDEDLALDVFAAQLLLDHRDAPLQAERIVSRLMALFPQLCERTDARSWLFGKPSLGVFRVRMGNDHFELQVDRGRVEYRTVHHVGGVDLSRHVLPQEQWLQQLMAAVASQSVGNDDAEVRRLLR
ncbi:hypothetical protein Q0M94_21825 (plasmid) [Deinococcus radiomollis]|uniref:hypothetical protein n=1 Tax=Deinococcus radiomollis TaxID=468916 RepID=UPI003892465B